jgi:hypothetical protein
MYYMGIDPGKAGGIAFISPDGKAIAQSMPETPRDICDLLRTMRSASGGDVRAFIESEHAFHKQGVTSAFTFGFGTGFLHGCLVALDICYEEISPARWQRGLSCLSGGDKNVTKTKCQALFPYIKVTHKIADALLIAEYGRRRSTGEISVVTN